jgi:tRNA dimethylallyltransferase
MIEAGLVDEARGLWQRGALGPTAGQALGYRQLVDHFEGRCDLDAAVERIKVETRRFAKNQRTWLRRLRTVPGSVWLDAGDGAGPDAGIDWAKAVLARVLGQAENTEHNPNE